MRGCLGSGAVSGRYSGDDRFVEWEAKSASFVLLGLRFINNGASFCDLSKV